MMPRQHNLRLRLLAGWCALLLYVVAFSPIGMGVAALLGTIDADHHAFFQPGAGGMRLVLHHERSCARHNHHAVARALSFFAQPAGDTDPDHVVQFAGTDGFWRDAQQIGSSENPGAQPQLDRTESTFCFADQPLFPLSLPRPAPDPAANLLNTRFTVLLI